MASIKRKGFGQVEPNHLSAQRTGQIYAQLIADSNLNIIENGMFLKYDYENRKAIADASVEGEWLLVYNEEKLYDPRRQNHKDFAMKKTDYVDGEMVPRLFKTNVGDIYTTNTLGANTSEDAETTAVTVALGDILVVGSTGYLEVAGQSPAGPQFKVVALTTMPDGQDAVKVQRIA
ncbi:MAG: hypothetical protein J6T10_18760 [Methanobrevibacter sp.]|nr:hypothetical protein [Methanobrevibacter sp.]